MLKPYFTYGDTGFSGKIVKNTFLGYKKTEYVIRKDENPYTYFTDFFTFGFRGFNYSIATNPINFLIGKVLGKYRLKQIAKHKKKMVEIDKYYANHRRKNILPKL